MRGSRNFFQGWQVQARRPQLILQFTEGVQWFYYRENYIFLRIQRGSNIFKGFLFFKGGGPNANSIENHITCDFPGGSGPTILPLDSHMQ